MISVLRRQLTDNLDEGLDAAGRHHRGVARRRHSGSSLRIDEDVLVQVIGADGRSRCVVESRRCRPPIVPLQTRAPDHRPTSPVEPRRSGCSPAASTTAVRAGHCWSSASTSTTSPTRVTILSRLLAVAVPAVVVVLGALTWWLTGRTLRPVDRIRCRDGRDQRDEPRPSGARTGDRRRDRPARPAR